MPPAVIRRLIEGGLTQTEISKRTGIPQPRLSRWVTNGAPVAAVDAVRLIVLEKEVTETSADAGGPEGCQGSDEIPGSSGE